MIDMISVKLSSEISGNIMSQWELTSLHLFPHMLSYPEALIHEHTMLEQTFPIQRPISWNTFAWKIFFSKIRNFFNILYYGKKCKYDIQN